MGGIAVLCDLRSEISASADSDSLNDTAICPKSENVPEGFLSILVSVTGTLLPLTHPVALLVKVKTNKEFCERFQFDSTTTLDVGAELNTSTLTESGFAEPDFQRMFG